jgi:uncharacterized protein
MLGLYLMVSCLLMVMFTIDPAGFTRRLMPERVAHLFAAWSPNVAAVLVIALFSGGSGVIDWAKGWKVWRVRPVWYFAALSPIGVAFLVPLLFKTLGGGLEPGNRAAVLPLGTHLGWILIMGATGEEGGWRGFAQHKLQSRISPLSASGVVGVMCTLWHVPAYFVDGLVNRSMPVWLLGILLVSNAVIMGWLWNGSGESILLASLYHFSLNGCWPIADAVLPFRAGHGSLYVIAGLYLVMAIGVTQGQHWSGRARPKADGGAGRMRAGT